MWTGDKRLIKFKSYKFIGAILVLAFIGSQFGVLLFAAADLTSANLPPRAVGDTWMFALDYKGAVGMKCYLNCTVTGSVTINGLDCFEFTSVGCGEVYGDNVSGTWSIQVKEYFVKSDFSLAKSIQTIDLVVVQPNGSTTQNQTIENLNNPPYGMNDGFPITVGKTWTATCNVTQTTTTTVDGQVSQNTANFSQITNFVVVSVNSTQTPVGTFQTFLIRAVTADGYVMDMYYSPDVHMQIAEVDYDSAGVTVASMDLVSYQFAEQGSQDPLPLYLAVVAVVCVAVVVSVVVARRQFNKPASS
jgi:hypothetical protein